MRKILDVIATLDGSLPFPEIVGRLIEEGVEYYHVDFASKTFTFYSAAGVQGYFAFLSGQRVTYLGRQGEQHVEWFPGAKPGDA